MKTPAAVTAIILAMVIGYAAGYATFLVRFPTREARVVATGQARMEEVTPLVHPIVAEVEKARKLHAAGKSLEAQKLLRDQLRMYPQAPEARPARELLGAINTGLFFSRDDLFGKTEYVVARGDSLARIAQRLKSSPEMIMRANNLDSTVIHVGDRLLVPDGDFTVTIDLPKERVVVHHGDGFFKQYPIQSFDLPASSQPRLATKVTATTFWKDGERVTASANEMGEATPWIQLARPGYILYGISEEGGIGLGTVEITEDNKSPPTAASAPEPNPDIPSRGIALLKDDLAELQLLLSRGTPVTIIRSRP